MNFNTLSVLKDYGFNPKHILDIGAYKGRWTNEVERIFPSSKFTLVEPIWRPHLQELEYKHSVMYELLYSENTTIDFYQMKNTGDSIFKEKTNTFADCKPIKKQTKTLDTLFKDMHFDLIKIDAQGSEIPILKGGMNLIKNTDFILLEIPFNGVYNENVPDFSTHITFMNSIDFIPFDIMEFHRIKDILVQVDILFVRKNHSINEKIQKILYTKGN